MPNVHGSAIIDTANNYYNASMAIAEDGKSILLSAIMTAPPMSTTFGWENWPINTVMSKEGFPLQPWLEKIP